MLNMLKQALQAVGEFQSRLILTLFYILVLPVFVVAAKVAGDPLGLRDFARSQSTWKARKPPEPDPLAEAHRQY